MSSVNRTSSVNSLLAGVNNIDYSSLQKVSNGTYNKGEIDLQKGFFGKYGFGKINNHVGYYADKNTVVRTAQQNLTTKAAVFKSILTRFAVGEEKNQIEGILASDDELQVSQQLANLKNPYVLEAYRFLLGDGMPLTRDEMRCLDSLLKGAEKKIKANGGISADEVGDKMRVLKNLKYFKGCGEFEDSGVQQETEAWIKGISVKGISRAAGSRVVDVSLNVRANRDSSDLMVKHMPKLCNACMENVMRLVAYSERTEIKVDQKTKERKEKKEHPVKVSDILTVVRTLNNGIDKMITREIDQFAQAYKQENDNDDVSASDVRDLAYGRIVDNFQRFRLAQFEWIKGAEDSVMEEARGKMTEEEKDLFDKIRTEEITYDF